VPAIGAGPLEHLLGQLARGHQDQGSQPVTRRVLVGQAMQDGKQKRGRLPGPGLGGSHDVATGEGEGNGLALNGRGHVVSLFDDRTDELGPEP